MTTEYPKQYRKQTAGPVLGALLTMLLAAATAPAMAGQWQICDLGVKVRDKQTSSKQLQTRVVDTQAWGDAECPQPGAALSFRPEAADHRAEVPRRQWPKAGETVKVRYRYLDGECKQRGSCRIQHYALVPAAADGR
ncbi:hypothetical protein GCM10010975_18710 [Comamonas phosphati]|nr:hypothetical protein GCM10010975_18710 [Comamonas phosphati]